MNARSRSVVGAVAWRSLHNFLTNPALFLPAIVFPLFFFAAFAGGLSNIGNVPGFDYPNGYTAFQFGFVLLQSAAFGGVFTGFGIAADFESGFGRRMMLAAPNRLAIIGGYWLAALARAGIIAALLFVIALAVGMDISSNLRELVAMVVLALLVNGAAALWGAGIALRFRSLQAGPLMQTPVFLVLFLAPVYVPLDLLNSWIHAIATINPITPILEAVRSLIAGDPEYVGLALAVGTALVLLFGLWAIRGMRSAEAAGG